MITPFVYQEMPTKSKRVKSSQAESPDTDCWE
jgi:hypothetical protein